MKVTTELYDMFERKDKRQIILAKIDYLPYKIFGQKSLRNLAFQSSYPFAWKLLVAHMETAGRTLKFPVDIWFSDYIEVTNLINENNSKEKLKNSFQSFWIILQCNTLAPQYGIKIEKFSKQPITLIILNVSSKGITWKNLRRRTLNYYHWYYYYFYYNDFF